MREGPSKQFGWLARTLVGSAIAFALYAAWALCHYGAYSRDFGWNFAQTPGGVSVISVDPAGPAAGLLKPGDRVLEMEGSRDLPTLAQVLAIRAIPASNEYEVRIRRQQPNQPPIEQVAHLKLRLTKDWLMTERQSPFLFGAIVNLLIAAVLLRRPTDPAARMFCALLVCFGVRQSLLVVYAFYNVMSPLERLLVLAVWAPEPFYLFGALEFQALYRFPPSVPKGRFWSGLQALLYAIYAWYALRGLALGRQEVALSGANVLFYPARAVYEPTATGFHAFLTQIYGLVATLAICAVMVRNYRRIDNIGYKRRLRWIMFGFAAGLSPYCVVILLQLIGDALKIPSLERGPQWTGVIWALNAWLAIIPISFGYAVARHRLFDIRLVVRQGLQYLLARRMLQALLGLPAIGVLLSIAMHPTRTVSQLLFEGSGLVNLVLLAGTAVSLRYRQKLLTWLDRKFFRQAYDSEALLMALPDKLRDLHSPAEVAAKIAEDVSAALHPSAVYFLAASDASGNRFSTIYSSDGGPVSFQADNASWEKSPLIVSELRSEREIQPLKERGVQLIVPLLGHQRLAGLLLLAERKSEEPYSARDRAMLEAIAAQAAVLLDKFRLEQELQQERQQVRQMAVRLGDEFTGFCRECPECGTCYDSEPTSCVHDGRTPVVVQPIERTIQYRYRLDRLVGRGGMGAVYAATDLRLKREVALKVMLSDLLGNERALHRFQREAEIAARLEHPNIVRIYDFGAVGMSGAYLVMEYLKGITVRSALLQECRLSPPVVARWMDALLAGMEWAHSADVVHRDLKPENLLLVEDRELGEGLKILDFGLAKVKMLQIAGAEQLTVPGMTMGTLGYMSPEQVAGSDIDHRTDIYAIGTIVVELLTGCVPSESDDAFTMLSDFLQGDVEQLATVVNTARARQRTHRYASAGDFRKALAAALANVEPAEYVIDRAMLLERLGIQPTQQSAAAHPRQ